MGLWMVGLGDREGEAWVYGWWHKGIGRVRHGLWMVGLGDREGEAWAYGWWYKGIGRVRHGPVDGGARG